MNKILTIVVPTYNMEALLEKDLNSLVIEDKQLMKEMEVLVVIDGATDRSSEIAHSFQDRYPDTFVVIDKGNGNYGSCVNVGVKEAKGKYIRIMDADDYYETTNLGDFLVFLHATNADVVLSDYDIVNCEGRSKKSVQYALKHNIETPIESIHSKEIMIGFVLHSITYRTELLVSGEYVQTEGVSYTDQEWITKPMRNVKTFSYFNKKIYHYLYGREGQTVDSHIYNKSISQHTVVLKSLAKFINDIHAEYFPSKKQIEQKVYWYMGDIYGKCIKTKDPVVIQMVKELDMYIKEQYPWFYAGSNKVSVFKNFNSDFIVWWRKNEYPDRIPMTYSFLAFVNSVVSFIKNRLISTKR